MNWLEAALPITTVRALTTLCEPLRDVSSVQSHTTDVSTLYGEANFSHTVGDDPNRVLHNRAQLVRELNLPQEPYWLTQVHGTDVVMVDRHSPINMPVTADASVTIDPLVVLAVLTADCLPVVLVSADGIHRGIAHAGWRGLLNGVLENTVARLRAGEDIPLAAWLGPCIGKDSFEVGDEVRAAFVARDATANQYFVQNPRGRFMADLPGLATQRLTAMGVCVSASLVDTLTDPRCYSYRRHAQAGRMATVVWWQGERPD